LVLDSDLDVNTSEALAKPDALTYPVATVRFETNRWALSAETLSQVAAIRDHLRARPTRGILIYAYTDTRGGQKLNQDLAQRRAAAVAQSLMAEGGISLARIFASALPKADHPSLTTQEADTPENRAVELRVIELPDRK
jgi:outer membrane protein OmpA-like peptidoglycan-associated protein